MRSGSTAPCTPAPRRGKEAKPRRRRPPRAARLAAQGQSGLPGHHARSAHREPSNFPPTPFPEKLPWSKISLGCSPALPERTAGRPGRQGLRGALARRGPRPAAHLLARAAGLGGPEDSRRGRQLRRRILLDHTRAGAFQGRCRCAQFALKRTEHLEGQGVGAEAENVTQQPRRGGRGRTGSSGELFWLLGFPTLPTTLCSRWWAPPPAPGTWHSPPSHAGRVRLTCRVVLSSRGRLSDGQVPARRRGGCMGPSAHLGGPGAGDLDSPGQWPMRATEVESGRTSPSAGQEDVRGTTSTVAGAALTRPVRRHGCELSPVPAAHGCGAWFPL